MTVYVREDGGYIIPPSGGEARAMCTHFGPGWTCLAMGLTRCQPIPGVIDPSAVCLFCQHDLVEKVDPGRCLFQSLWAATSSAAAGRRSWAIVTYSQLVSLGVPRVLGPSSWAEPAMGVLPGSSTASLVDSLSCSVTCPFSGDGGGQGSQYLSSKAMAR